MMSYKWLLAQSRYKVVPFVGYIGSCLAPGCTIRIQGTVHPTAQRFAINLQCGPNVSPRDDVALHLSPDFNRSYVVRNNILCMNWGPEESLGHFPFMSGQPFDIMVLCEARCYKIAINGQHFTDFEHRTPYNRVTHLAVDGDVSLVSIEYGGGLLGSHTNMPMPGAMPMPGTMPIPGAMPAPIYGMPVPGQMPLPGPGHVPSPGFGYPKSPSPSYYSQSPASFPAHCPTQYPSQPPLYPGQNQNINNYPTYKKPSVLEQAGMTIAGTAIGSKLLGKGGGLGTAMAGGLAGAALTGHLSPKKALKKQKKAHKKALKYGIPLAGVGLGAYAIHKMGHHSHSSSSSSSSSSEEE